MDRKARHEQFVTGLEGGTVADVYAVAGICALGVVAYHLVAKVVGNKAGALRLADYVFNWATMLVATTLYANRLPVLTAVLFTVGAAAFMASDQSYTTSRSSEAEAESTISGSNKGAMKTNLSTSAAKYATKNVAKPGAKSVGSSSHGRPAGSRHTAGSSIKSSKTDSINSTEPIESPISTSQVVYRPFLTVYRSAMMVLTCTAILGVDFPAFPRRFAKTETWGTSLMDLGVGSFVFSMGVVSSRSSLKYPRMGFNTEATASIKQTAKVFALGLFRLIMVKQLDYQEHESEYGVHWNFFFTLGLLPLAFVLLKRLPPNSTTGKACLLALGYEVVLKNMGLLEWTLIAPRTSIISQNKEGIASFAGYLAIFSFGYAYGLRLMQAQSTLRSICIMSAKWAIIAQLLFSLLRVATEPSRRLANLPYIVWVVAFNSGFIGLFAACEYLLNMKPSPSYTAVNSFGETIFVLANIGTGIVNLSTDTMALSPLGTQSVLVCYQVALMTAAKLLYNRRRQ